MKIKQSGIIGLGAYIPKKIVTNFDLEKIMDTSDEWIKTRTGIEERRFVEKGEATSDLAVEAAKRALKCANVSIEEIDMIIVATCTPDYQIPSTACVVQKKIGAINAAAMDLGAACSGFIYGLTVAKGLVGIGTYKKVMVIGAEVLSSILDMNDRNTAVLFGDGAAAAIVSEVEEGFGLLSTHLGADGDLKETLGIKSGGSLHGTTAATLEGKEHFLRMKGQEVFKFAVKALPTATLEALKLANLKSEDIDLIVPHQASRRIIEAASKKIEVPMEKFFLNLSKVGNTSAASIGIALDEALEKKLIKKGDIIAITGFGGGLTFGSIIMKWCY